MIEQAVVLVGGRGSRLGELTRQTPKPLLGVAGRPFISWLVDELRRFGVKDVLLLAGYRAEQFDAAFAGAADVRVVAEPRPLGTGGALRLAAEHLAERFFFLNGDSFFDINLWDLAAVQPGAEATLAVRAVADASRYGRVRVQDGWVTGFAMRSEAPGPGLINGGVGIFARRLVDRIEAGCPVSIEHAIYPRLAAEGRLAGRAYDSAFIDIGVPQDYRRAQTFIPRQLRRGAVFLCAGWEPAGDAFGAPTIDAIKAINDAGLLAVLAAPFADGPTVSCAEANAVLTRFGAHLDGLVGAFGAVERAALIDRLRMDPNRIAWIGPPGSAPELFGGPDIPAALRGGPEALGRMIARLGPGDTPVRDCVPDSP